MADPVHVVQKNDGLKPWMRGPYELLKHASEHFIQGDDTDRRIALMGFDNAIEVSLEVFIRLHPRLRGHEIRKDDVEKALRNFHEKITFLEKYAAENDEDIDLPISEILWFHSLRNELYHSGNGMVPEMHVVEDAQNAAIDVFQILFKVDAGELRPGAAVAPDRPAKLGLKGLNGEMDLLSSFNDFEDALRKSSVVPQKGRFVVGRAWHDITELNPELARLDKEIVETIELRNRLAHGRKHGMSESQLFDRAFQLMEVTEIIGSI